MDSRKQARQRIAIVDPHLIVAKGIQALLEELSHYEVRVVITGDCLYFADRVRSSASDILIINPLVLEYGKRSRVDELMEKTGCMHVIALVSQHLEYEVIGNYSAAIDISDSVEKISLKLKKLAAMERVEQDASELTQREKEILVSVAKGLMNKEIADKHHLSIHTVITHRKNISRKTGIKSVSGLTVFAILNNLVDIQEIE